MVGAKGFEPSTSWSQTRRSTRLSYAPKIGGVKRGLFRFAVKNILKFVSDVGTTNAEFEMHALRLSFSISSHFTITAMDNISSADLDTSTKTPLFVAIAAVIVAVTGVALGWLGFSKANALEAKIAEVSGAAGSIAEIKTTVDGNSEMVRRAAGKLSTIERGLTEVTEGVRKDISDVKKNMRSLAIQAGTALQKAEALEANGVAPAPRSSSSGSDSLGQKSTGGGGLAESPAGAGEHTIQSGDTYQKLSSTYKVSVNDLIDANPGVDPRRLRIGQKIVIPSAGN